MRQLAGIGPTAGIMGNLARSMTDRSTVAPPMNAAACDSLLSRWDLSADDRAHILRESVEHAPTLSEIVAQAEFHNVQVATPEGWNAYNPSIASTSRGLLMTVRSSNWEYKRHHYFRVNDSEGIARSRSYLLQLDADLASTSSVLLRDGTDRTGEVAARYRGYEDLRLFELVRHLGAVATTLDFSPEGISQLTLLGISGDQLLDRHVISDGRSRGEKNWSPAIWNGELFLIYAYAPMMLLRWDGHRLHPAGFHANLGPPIALDFKGGSQLVSTPAGLLTVVHVGADYPDESRVYMHRFVLLDEEFRIIGLSRPFTFRQRGIEFAAGLAMQGADVIVSFGADDAECWLVRLALDSALSLLRPPIEVVAHADDEAAKRIWPPLP